MDDDLRAIRFVGSAVLMAFAMMGGIVALVGCASQPAKLPPPAPVQAPVCLPLVSYPPEQQKQAAAELAKLPSGSVVAQMVVDYGKMRAADRACLGAK